MNLFRLGTERKGNWKLANQLHYSETVPGFLAIRISGENPFVPSGPRGCLVTISLGPPSSSEIVLSRLINRSGLCWFCDSLKKKNHSVIIIKYLYNNTNYNRKGKNGRYNN